MDTLQAIFNNREIAIGFWAMVSVIALLFVKSARKPLKVIIRILRRKEFVAFYLVFSGFLFLVLAFLKWVDFWNSNLLKDTIFWVFFVEFPIFVKTIEKAKDSRFFGSLIKENIALSAFIEFFVGFWTFSLWVELILIPITVFFSLVYALSEREKKYQPVKKFFDRLIVLWGLIILITAIQHFFQDPEQFINIDTLKSFLLPIVLLFLNLPVVYGLALYNTYEQIFIRLKGRNSEKVKMKLQVLRFAGINLAKASALRNSIPVTILHSLTAQDLQNNLNSLTQRLSLQIGDNYMKRSHYYIVAFTIGLFASLFGLISINSDVSLKDLISFNFTFNIQRAKEILTYIFSTMLVFSATMLVFSIGFNKKQREDISQIKKYALYELLVAAKRQKYQLMEYPPIDDPAILYVSYILNAFEVKKTCEKVLSSYSNLLTTWECDVVKQLQLCANSVVSSLGICAENIDQYNVVSFSEFYDQKVRTSPQNEKINNFTYMVQKDLKKYSEQIELFCNEFKQYY